MGLYEDELRKAQQFRAELNAREQAQQAALNMQNRALANQQAQSQQKQGGLLGVLQGIGESIGNVGSSLYNIAGTGAASIGDLFASIGSGKVTTKNQDDWKQHMKRLNGDENMSDKDYYLKTAGKSLDAAATVSDFIPGLGKAGKVALNVGQGVASGVGNQFANNGENTTLEQALQGGLIGGLSAGAGQAVGGKLAKISTINPAQSLLGKAVQSGIGRSALTGAASGAVGGGLATALQGGDFGQTLQGALEGAGQGALGGATTGAVYGLAGTALDKVNNKILNGKKSGNQIPTNVLADTEETIPEGTRRRQTALGWDGEQVDASKRNAWQKIGKAFEDTGKSTENARFKGKLDNSTANQVRKNDTINVLKKKYGYTSADYDRAADLSSATNAWIRNEAATSGASGYDTGLTDKISLNNIKDGQLLVSLTDKNAKLYRNKTQQLLNSARVQGGGIDEYSAAGLYDAADAASKMAHSMYESSHDKKNGTVLGSDKAQELNALSQAYSTFAKEARTAADNMLGGTIDDITRSNLTKMLKNSGAPEAAVKTLSKAKTLSELKTLTSPLETARDITDQIARTRDQRGATTDNSIKLTTRLANSLGASQAADELIAPVGQVVGKAEQKFGKALTKIGDAVAGDGKGITGKTVGKVANLVKAANNGLNVGDADYGFSDTVGKTKLTRGIRKAFSGNEPLTVGDLATRAISREAGQIPVNNARITKEQTDAQNAYNEAAAANDAALANYQNVMAQIQAEQAQNSEGAQKLQQISDAMDQALAMGDITAYSKLADLYSTAYKIYGKQLEAAQAAANPLSNLTSAQIENINKLDTASNAIDELESLFQKAGGGQGLIGGNAASFMASLGLNSDVSTYNSMARGLINEISAATGKTDALNNEGEVQRALDLIPKVTDDAQTATNKLEQLRRMLATNKQTVYKNYGLTS